MSNFKINWFDSLPSKSINQHGVQYKMQ